jgi:hypothetical protein
LVFALQKATPFPLEVRLIQSHSKASEKKNFLFFPKSLARFPPGKERLRRIAETKPRHRQNAEIILFTNIGRHGALRRPTRDY